MHRKYITPIVGLVYTNRNGDDYICRSVNGSDGIMERIKDSWTLVAHGIQQYGNGTIEWNYSTGGHWNC